MQLIFSGTTCRICETNWSGLNVCVHVDLPSVYVCGIGSDAYVYCILSLLCSVCVCGNNTLSGDNAPHEVWNETWASQYDASKFLMDYLAQKLPNTTIYPAIGNHGRLMVLHNQ